MFFMRYVGIGMLLASALVVGCPDSNKKSEKDGGKKIVVTKEKEDDHGPHGQGPNGGTVFDLGSHHAEFTVDHGKRECAVVVLSVKDNSPKEVAGKDLTVNTKETKTKEGKVVPAMTIKLNAASEKDGKASKFVGSDPGLANVVDFEGTVVGEINGKLAKGTFKED